MCIRDSVNAVIFKRFLIRTGEKLRALQSDPTKLREVTIQFDRAKSITDFFSTRQVNTLWQAPYSLDLNLCDRWLFSRLKRSLQHMEFNNHEEVKSQTLQLIRSIPQNEFQKELDKLFNHCQSVIDCGGDYVVSTFCEIHVFGFS